MNKKIKKLNILMLIAALCLSMIPTTVFGATNAKSIASSFYVNETMYCTEAFSYGGDTYYKLLDVAYALKDVPKKIKITATGNSLQITKGTSQAFVKGIFCGARGKSYSATAISSATYDGSPIEGKVYKINKDFCMKMGDIAKIINVTLTKSSTQRIKLDCSKPNVPTNNTGTVYTKDWPSGTYIIRPAGAPKQALSVGAASQKSGAKFILWPYNGGYHQQFIITKNGSEYTMTVAHSGLNVGLGGLPGSYLVQQKAAPTRLIFESTSKGTRIKIKGYVTYMGVSGGNFGNGTPLITWSKASDNSQFFILEKID